MWVLPLITILDLVLGVAFCCRLLRHSHPGCIGPTGNDFHGHDSHESFRKRRSGQLTNTDAIGVGCLVYMHETGQRRREHTRFTRAIPTKKAAVYS